jgi:hypothetical protein
MCVPPTNPPLRGLLQHIHILTHLAARHRKLSDHLKKDFRRILYEYALTMCFEEFQHRLRFGIDHTAFYDFFVQDSPDFTHNSNALLLEDFFSKKDRRTDESVQSTCEALAVNLKREWDRVEADRQNGNRSRFMEWQEVMDIKEAAYSWVKSGVFEVNGMKIIHIMLRFRLRWIRDAVNQNCDLLRGDRLSSSGIQLWALQCRFRTMYFRIAPLVKCYMAFIDAISAQTPLYQLPQMWSNGLASNYTHPASNVSEWTQRKDGDFNRLLIRQQGTWGNACLLWIGQLTTHVNAAMSIINDRTSRKLEWAGDGVKCILVDNRNEVTTSLTKEECEQVVKAPFTTRERDNVRIRNALDTLIKEDLNWQDLVDDKIPCPTSIGAILAQHIVDVARPIAKNVKLRTMPLIGANRRIPFAEAVAIDIILRERYGKSRVWDATRLDLADVDNTSHEARFPRRLTVDPRIEPMALPKNVSRSAAENILGRLSMEFRHRLSKIVPRLEHEADELEAEINQDSDEERTDEDDDLSDEEGTMEDEDNDDDNMEYFI